MKSRSIIAQSSEQLVQHISQLVDSEPQQKRKLIAIAGPPATGKSTLLTILCQQLAKLYGQQRVVGIPMDGFHLDNVQLESMDLTSRKGSPDTFDVDGLVSLIARIAQHQAPVYAPEFDRDSDLSRNCAIKIDNSHDVVLVEGNYLLLNRSGWNTLPDYFDLTISIQVPDNVLEERLLKRWADHGLSADAALAKAQSNDLPNAATVRAESLRADITYTPENT